MATLKTTTVNGTLRSSSFYPYESVAHGGEDYPIFILPKIRYNGPDNIDPTHNPRNYFKALIKYICKKYPNTKQGLWFGSTNPNSISTSTIHIYETSDVSDELPRYSSGTSFSLDGEIYQFGTIEYNWYFYTTLSDHNYSNTLDNTYVRYTVANHLNFQNTCGINNIAFIEGTNEYSNEKYDSVIFESSIDAGEYGFCSQDQARNGYDTDFGYIVTGSGKLIPSSSFVWTASSLEGIKLNNGSYGGVPANMDFTDDFMKTHSYMGSIMHNIDNCDWHNIINIVHRGYQVKENGTADTTNTSDNYKYGLQIRSRMTSYDAPLKFRHYFNGDYGSWIRVWDDNNLKLSYSDGVLSITATDN